MVDAKVNVQKALRAYQKVVDLGEKQGDRYCLDGMSVWSEADGYSVSLAEGEVVLQIFFHQRFSLQAPNRAEAAFFLRKLDSLNGK